MLMMPMPRSSMWYRIISAARPTSEPFGILADLDDVVGDEPVAALDEVERALALADPRVADEEDAHAVDVHEDAVHGRRGRELVLENARDRLDDDGGRFVRDEQRHVARAALAREVFGNVLALRDDEGRDGQAGRSRRSARRGRRAGIVSR